MEKLITASQIIKDLNLAPLPGEGGYYRETYRSGDGIVSLQMSDKELKNRCLTTAIYYLVTPETFSSLHRLPQDEIFHSILVILRKCW